MTSFTFLVVAETRKLSRRMSARLGWIVALGVGLFAVLALLWLSGADIQVSGERLGTKMDTSGQVAAIWALQLRNFFILRVLIVVLGAVCFASELRSHTLREDLLRPVHRAHVLLAKWLSLCSWIVVATLLTLVASLLPGLLFMGSSGEWSGVFLGYLVTAVADCGFATLVLLVAVLFRSVIGTIAGVFLFLLADKIISWVLVLVDMIMNSGMIPPQTIPAQLRFIAQEVQPWLPSTAFGVWKGYPVDQPWVWQGFVVLALMTLSFLILSILRFRKIDVP